MCIFILRIFTTKVVCCPPISVSVRFSISACMCQTHSLTRSLTTRPCHTRFCVFGLLSFFALMSILDGLFHSLSITLFFTCSATTLFRPPLRRCVLCQSRLLSSVCFYGLPAPFKLNLCASNKQFRTFFVSMSQINRNLSFHSPIFTCRLLVHFSLLLTCFSLSAYHTEYRKYNILKREKRDTYL